MSQDEHHEHDGGHELEGLNVMSLFKVIGVSIVLVYASIVGVTQLFYQQRAGIILDNSDYTFLEDQRAQESKMLAGIEGISAEVAKDPKKLVASPPPEGWVHPDDIAAGITASPAAGAAAPAGAAPAAKPATAAPTPAAVAKPAPVNASAKPATNATATKK